MGRSALAAALVARTSDRQYSPSSFNSLGSSLKRFVFLSGIQTEENRQKLEGYLAHKWALTAKLPAGHPYKTVAP